jgi:hypothetical protein
MSQHQDSEGVFQSIFGDEPLELLLKPAPPSPKRPRTLPLNAPGVYILRLSGCRFYVGRSEDVTKRVQAHWEGQGSTWTRRHKVLGVEHVLPQPEGTTLEKLELVTTIEQMKKRGIHRVRGSCFSQAEFTEEDIKFAQRLICTCSNWCFNCGASNHIQRECQKAPGVWQTMPALDEDVAWEYRHLESTAAGFDTKCGEYRARAESHSMQTNAIEPQIATMDTRLDDLSGKEMAFHNEIAELAEQIRTLVVQLQKREEEKREIVTKRREVELERRLLDDERRTNFNDAAAETGKANEAHQEALKARAAMNTLAANEARGCPNCGKGLQLKKSMTQTNPDRLFLACFVQTDRGQCYFKWLS